jgi:hypothetical protein
MAGPRPSITCIDCGGEAHLITPAPEDNKWYPGDIVAYRCRDCRDRWDLELTIEDVDDERPD